MPVKKHSKKKIKKTDKKKDKERENIKGIVSDIPSLIMKEMHSKQDPDEASELEMKNETLQDEFRESYGVKPMNPAVDPIEHDKKKWMWMWTGVIIFSVVIFGIWIISVKSLVYNFKTKPGPEKSLIQETQKDLKTILTEMTEEDKTLKKQADNIKNRGDKSLTDALKESIISIFLPSESAATTTTTSTPEI